MLQANVLADKMPSAEKIKQIYTSVLLNCIYFMVGVALSIQSILYPGEAEARGSTPSQYGFVFGIVQFSLFMFSIAFGKYETCIGSEYLAVGGTSLLGIASTAFAFLNYTEDLTTFLAISYALRFAEGLGAAATYCSGYVIVTQIHPSATATVISFLGSMHGFGLAVGPSVGTWLYMHG